MVLALGIFHSQILTAIATFMTIRDPIERADLILPLYHDGDTVPFAAADLYRRGYADRVALGSTKPTRLEALGLSLPPHKIWRRVLEAEGVSPRAIITIGSHIRNEVELGQALAAYLQRHGHGRTIVVASAPVSRLSRKDLRRGLAGSPAKVLMYPVPPREFDERSWWRSRHGWIRYFDAYFLLALRWVRNPGLSLPDDSGGGRPGPRPP